MNVQTSEGVDGSPWYAEVELTGTLGGLGTTTVLGGRDVSLSALLASRRDRVGTVVRMRAGSGNDRRFVLTVASCGEADVCLVKDQLEKSFEYELDPAAVLMHLSAERLVSERIVEENMGCINQGKSTHWCGQSATRLDGALYDMTIRRAAGYDHYAPVQ